MPSWKKVLVSGSAANLSSLQVDTFVSASSISISQSLYDKNHSTGSTGQVLSSSPQGPVWTNTVVALTTGSAVSASTIDINLSTFAPLYDELYIDFNFIKVHTNNIGLWAFISSDGSTYPSASGNYKYQVLFSTSTSTGGLTSTSDTHIFLGNNISVSSSNMNVLEFKIRKPNQSTFQPSYEVSFNYTDNNNAALVTRTFASRLNAQVTNGVRFQSTGSLISGNYVIKGLKYV